MGTPLRPSGPAGQNPTRLKTRITDADANQDEIPSESTPGGSTYGRTDSNGLPEIELVTDNGTTGYVLHDPTGTPVMLQSSSGMTCLYLYDGIGNPIGLFTSASTTSLALQYAPMVPRRGPTAVATTAVGPKTLTCSKEAPKTASPAK